MYQAALLCDDCGERTRDALDKDNKTPPDVGDERTYDSDDYPKGPLDASESDCPDHCDQCGVFLENPLTEDGVQYVRNALAEFEATGRGNPDVLKEWEAFYQWELE